MTTPVLTPTPQDRALIAMLRDFEDRRRHPIDEHDGPYYIGIVIFTHIPDEDEDGEEKKSDATLWWRVHLTLGGLEIEGEGATFAAAWDAMVSDGDVELDDNRRDAKRMGIELPDPTAKLSNFVNDLCTAVTKLSAQETELIMSLRRRAATRADYSIIFSVNEEDHPGEWVVNEKKEMNGSGFSFAAAWDERF